MSRDIPPVILNAIAEGRAILFLGAGASYDATLRTLTTSITSDDVKKRLSEQFLGGAFKDRTLMTVADFARNESSLLQVQTAIRELFLDLSPSPFHCIVPTFRWHAIVSTNYDLIVERAYQTNAAIQVLAKVTRDGSELQEALSAQNTVPYLKLHGCIDNYKDLKTPLVLDSLEYSKFSDGRANLVTTFKEWAINNPIIFCGYRLGDENIKQLLFDIGDTSQTRPQYLYINKSISEIEARYWGSRRITPYSGTYAEFLEDIDRQIPAAKRTLAAFFSRSHLSIARWIPSHSEPSAGLLQYLSQELVHVTPEAPAGAEPDPFAFYSGLDSSFGPIYAGLDVPRKQSEFLINRVVLDTLKSTQPKFFLLLGYAGSGKSVMSRRLAIETAGLIDKPLVVQLSEGAVLRTDLLLELQELVASRLYVFLDDIIEYQESLPQFLQELHLRNAPITLFACARTGEFNAVSGDYQGKITRIVEVDDLEETEIDALLQKLAESNLLGPLKNYDAADRKMFVDKFYGRQLLVALHEITRGASFEDIILDEFEKVIPREAQQFYLDICTLHQCRVAVRAGLMSRISHYEISSLKQYLAGPLEKVVRTAFDYRFRDFVYRSRHEEISRLVFSLAIKTAEQRAAQLRRVLGCMDLNYTSDNKAFFDLVKGRRLADDFQDKALADSVFDAAEASSPHASYVLHQRAILELNHAQGSVELANDLLRRAEIEAKKEGTGDFSIQHTKANLLRRRANSAMLPTERARYRADARAILKPQLGRRHNTYPEHLYGQLLLDEMRDTLGQVGGQIPASGNESAVRLINELTSLIDEALRQRPTDEPMTVLKADFLTLLGKSANAVGLLARYTESNPGAGLAVRVLGETLIESGKLSDAIRVLTPSVLAAPSDKNLSLSLARALMLQDEASNSDAILSYLRRSFNDGDSNYSARVLFARFSLLYGDLRRGEEEFRALGKVLVDSRQTPRDFVIQSDGALRRFTGRIMSKFAGYAFVTSSDLRFNAFFPKGRMGNQEWDALRRGGEVTFTLGFTFRGPVACDVRPAC